jgi:hypothetical protein
MAEASTHREFCGCVITTRPYQFVRTLCPAHRGRHDRRIARAAKGETYRPYDITRIMAQSIWGD